MPLGVVRVWRYNEILKGMYMGRPAIESTVGATPSTFSLKRVQERLSALEQILRDILSRLDSRSSDELFLLVESVAKAVKEQGEYISRLEDEVSKLRSEFEKVLNKLDRVSSLSKSIGSQSSILSRIEQRIKSVEKAIEDISRNMEFVGFRPVDMLADAPGEPVPIGGGVSGFNIRKPVRKRSKK